MYCTECGAHQSGSHRFCGRCGALLPTEAGTGELTGPIPTGEHDWHGTHADAPVLAVRAGGPTGALFPVSEGRVTIGRSPKSDVFLDDVTVSRDHAQITREGTHAVLRDLDSLNGTYVNRRRIDEDEPLHDGDELQIGKFRLTYLGA
jgi:FHA domain